MTIKAYLRKFRKTRQKPASQSASPNDIEPTRVSESRLSSDDASQKLKANTNHIEGSEEQTLGLRLLTQYPNDSSEAVPSRYPVDIIFVHGLDGHFLRTWTHENGTCWARDLLPSELPGSRIFSYGYPSKVMANKSDAGIRDYAKHLLGDIKRHYNESRPIIFVCHSLGGIVTKQAMIMAHLSSRNKATWSATNAIIFMGTPHNGSTYAAYAKKLANVANLASHLSLTHRFTGGVRSPLLESLKVGNKELESIAGDFVDIARNIRIISFYETTSHPLTNEVVRYFPTDLELAPSFDIDSMTQKLTIFKIVDKTSAKSGAAGEIIEPLYLHHQNICQFSGFKDDNFLKVLQYLREQIPEPSESAATETSLRSDYSFDEIEKQCASLLNTLDIAGQEAKVGTRVDGTLEWVLQKQQYTEWVSSSRTRLLWVTGYAGTGKTVLSSFVSHLLSERQPRALVCRFFCDANTEVYSDPCGMLRSLIYQLVDQKRKLWRTVKKTFEAGGSNVFNQFESLWNLLVRLTSSETKRTLAIIIDSIDELQHDAHLRIFERIARLLSSSGSKLMKFFITSRPAAERLTQHHLNPLQVTRLALWDNIDEINHDIKCVIHFRLEELVRRGVCKPVVRDMFEQALVEKADHTFLWIKVVLPLIERRPLLTLDDIDSILNLVPGELESLYEHLLFSIPEDFQDIAAAVLRLLVVCDRPLTGDEIGTLITIKRHHKSAIMLQNEISISQDNVLILLGSLVRIHDSHIELVHISLREYLLSLSKLAPDEPAARFSVDLKRDGRSILQSCLNYLSLEEFQSDIHATLMSTDGSQSTWREDTPTQDTFSQAPSTFGFDLFDEPMFAENTFADASAWLLVREKHPAFDFVALHWPSILRLCADVATDEDVEKAISLCQTSTPVFKNWFHYYWLKAMPLESLPSGIDVLTVTSFLGHHKSLEVLLNGTTDHSSRSTSNAIYWAAHQAHDTCFFTLMSSPSFDPRNPGSGDQLPLLAAAQCGRLEPVRLLLEDTRTDIDAPDSIGRSALFLATAGNHLDVVKMLLGHANLNVNLSTRSGNHPLHVAIDIAAEPILKALLSDSRTNASSSDKSGRSILSWAAEQGHTGCVSIILDATSNLIEAKDIKGRTPLSYAAQYGHLSTVRVLIKKGHADPLAKDTSGRNIHSWAAMQRNTSVLDYLLRYPSGADVPDNDDWAPIAWTIDAPGYIENFRLLLHRGHVDANRKDGVFGRSLLSWIASSNQSEMAAELIAFPDIDLESRDLNGRTPLSEAAASGSAKIVQMLLATGGVDINSTDNQGQTPLMWAVKEARVNVVKLLLARDDVSADTRGASGELALEMAKDHMKTERNDIVAAFHEDTTAVLF